MDSLPFLFVHMIHSFSWVKNINYVDSPILGGMNKRVSVAVYRGSF